MDLTMYTLRSVAYAIFGPYMFFVLILLGVMFYFKNRKVSLMQKMIIGESINSPLELTLSQIVLGIFAGAIGSLILSYSGVLFGEKSGIEWVFLLSILLMIYRPKFVCFSYSGSILGIISIILYQIYGDKAPINISIINLMIFVGILHIVEGLLVMFDGSRGAIPVFTNKSGRIFGGFALNRYWALPIAIFMIITSSTSQFGTESINTPNWWPLLNHNSTLEFLKMAVVGLFPFYGMIGYSSITFTKSKRKKAVMSGIFILCYGMILVLVSQLCRVGLIGEIIVVIFAPLAHEVMIRLSNSIEAKSAPMYISDDQGICILEVSPSSQASKLGIRSGDKIIKVNEEYIQSELDIYKIIRESYLDIKLRIKKLNGTFHDFTITPDENRRIGVVLVPKMVKEEQVVKLNNDFQEILENIKKKKDDE
ncbi:site-2 protease family protein [Clostridium sp. 'White wine YQ']|uniref:site-2 protease family protein n=1 Tax=Clostridium sp. 'White wine YQ' TaxID=3027474 RepID=UPI002366B0F6|nr:site-2 protease family protein [Clostridium sp. 'White wine YQ']MDD7795653.1 signal protein PDZ [Clostridium sp. 'White wine YQ']